MEFQGTPNSQNSLEQDEQSGNFTLPAEIK